MAEERRLEERADVWTCLVSAGAVLAVELEQVAVAASSTPMTLTRQLRLRHSSLALTMPPLVMGRPLMGRPPLVMGQLEALTPLATPAAVAESAGSRHQVKHAAEANRVKEPAKLLNQLLHFSG